MKALLFLSAIAVACAPRLPPTGQVLLYVDTDAWVPSLFDALEVEVQGRDRTQCANCSRVFALDAKGFADRAVSFGVLGNERVVRLRMYTTTATLSGAVPERDDGVTPQSVIEAWVRLPAAPAEGILERTVVLRTEDVGTSRGTFDAPIDPDIGPPVHSVVGSWPGAKTVDCPVEGNPDEVCVPGGAFWMGNPYARGLPGYGNASNVRRLVRMSPFFLDAAEVTVAQYRSFDTTIPPGTSGDGSVQSDYCTFGKNDSLPVNCVTWERARTFCTARGRDLPTEAQFEFAAGGRAGNLFVWGNDSGVGCEDLIFGRAGPKLLLSIVTVCNKGRLLELAAPMPPGSGARDHLTLPTGRIEDLAGNVSEWARDLWNQQSDPCWSDGGVFVDPLCPGTDPKALHAARGGYWFASTAAYSEAAARRSIAGNTADIAVGFRCARDLRP